MKEKFSGYRIAIGCGLVIFFHMACCYIISAVLPYFVAKFQCPLAVITGSTSVGTLIGFAASMTTGSVLKKWQPRKAMMIGTLVCALFMLTNAFAFAPWVLYISNGISGFILAYGSHVSCAAVINRWFIEKRNTILGIVFGSAAFGGSLYMFLAGQLIGRVGQTSTYLILGAIAVGVALFSEIFLIRNTPEEVGQKPLGWKAEKAQTKEAVVVTDTVSGITPAEAKKSKAYIIMIFATFFGAMLLSSFTTLATTFWTGNGVSQASAATYASIVTLLGGIASALLGGVADKWGIKTYITAILGIFSIGLITAILWDTILPIPLMLILNILFISAGTPIKNISSTIVLPVFGPKAADSINGNLMAFFNAGSAFLIVFSILYDLLGSFTLVFGIVLALTLLVYILMMAALKLAPNKK